MRDLFGREYKVGDWVIYAWQVNHACGTNVAIVTSINKSTVGIRRYDEMAIWDESKREFKPGFVGSSLRRPERHVIVDESVIPNKMRELA